MKALLSKDWAIAALGLVGILLWDWSGWDMQVVRWFGNAQGFALREVWWFRSLLHDGGRLLSFALLALMLLDAFYPLRAGPSRLRRGYWVGVTLLSVLLVQWMKRASATSCPWDLAEFGGVARYVTHWQFGYLDGGAGHCFPAGHASGAFVFFSLYFLWREHEAKAARALLAGVALAGLAFSLTQLVRGAHYPSHMMWAAWLCWTACTAAAYGERRWVALPAPESLSS
jgi:membrane-associated PAP2 superfamily phosphatase